MRTVPRLMAFGTLIPYSSFDDPTEPERRQYAVWWQNKLKSNTKLEFPDSLLDKVAHETNHFSFAYLKEAL